jgi:hypothetical protein
MVSIPGTITINRGEYSSRLLCVKITEIIIQSCYDCLTTLIFANERLIRSLKTDSYSFGKLKLLMLRVATKFAPKIAGNFCRVFKDGSIDKYWDV